MIVDAKASSKERFLRARVAALEAANEALRERNAWLERELYGRDWVCPAEFGLWPAERRVLAALVAQPVCSRETLHRASAKPGREPESAPKLVDVMVCRIRSKLTPHGLEIKTIRDLGYSMDLASRRRLLAWPGTDLFRGRKRAA